MRISYPKHKILIPAILFAALYGLLWATPSYAQDAAQDKKEQTLKDIFSPDEAHDTSGKPKSGSEMAYAFYEKCAASKDFFISEKSQKDYCACKAAKMEETMTARQIAVLEEDSKAGSEARTLMRMNADANCMKEAIKAYTYGICLKDNQLKKIVIGKGTLCRCIRDLVQKRTRRSLPQIIIKAATAEPLSTNPLTFYLQSQDYEYEYDMSKQYCYTQFTYNQVNSRQ